MYASPALILGRSLEMTIDSEFCSNGIYNVLQLLEKMGDMMRLLLLSLFTTSDNPLVSLLYLSRFNTIFL